MNMRMVDPVRGVLGRRVGLAAAVCWSVSAGLAQVVTPPTAAPPKTPEYVPPPPAPTPPPAARPAPPARPATPAKPALPDEKYESLVKTGPDGKVAALSQPVHRAALEVNPLILKDEETKRKVAAALTERAGLIEQICVNSLDALIKVDDDGLNRVQATDAKDRIREINAMVNPVMPPGGELTTALMKSGVITEMQGQFNYKIVNEYNAAYFKDSKIPTTTRIYTQRVEETVRAYHGLLREAAANLGQVTPVLNLPTEKTSALTELVGVVKSAAGDDAKVEAMRKFMREIPVDQGREVLKKVIALRPK